MREEFELARQLIDLYRVHHHAQAVMDRFDRTMERVAEIEKTTQEIFARYGYAVPSPDGAQ